MSVKGGIYMKKSITAFVICILVLLTIPGTVMAKELQMKDIAISDCKVIFEVGDSTEIDLQNVPTGAKITWKSSAYRYKKRYKIVYNYAIVDLYGR